MCALKAGLVRTISGDPNRTPGLAFDKIFSGQLQVGRVPSSTLHKFCLCTCEFEPLPALPAILASWTDHMKSRVYEADRSSAPSAEAAEHVGARQLTAPT